MRQITLQTNKKNAESILETAKDFEAKNIIQLTEKDQEIITLHLMNRQVGAFLEKLEDYPDVQINLIPRGVITLYPPQDEAPDQVRDVDPKSSIEIFLSSIQSVGSYKGLIGYAVSAGVIVWIGLYTNTFSLLIAAMLIAPYAGPAMNLAIATTAGEKALFRKSLTRYFVSITIGAAVAALLSWLIGQQTATSLMIDVGQVSEVSLLLPLISGFAGALSMVQDERDSLVSGAAIGILVSASLAPPVGLVGMGAVCGEWALVRNGAFLILLQLAGINLSAALVFRFYGKITTKRIRFNNGSKALAFSVGLGSLAVIALLLWFQFSKTPRLQKGSINMKIAETIKNNFKTIPEANLIETTVSFTRADSKGTERLLCEVLVTPKPAGEKLTDAELKELLFKKLDQEVKHRKYNIKPVFNITVLREGTAP